MSETSASAGRVYFGPPYDLVISLDYQVTVVPLKHKRVGPGQALERVVSHRRQQGVVTGSPVVRAIVFPYTLPFQVLREGLWNNASRQQWIEKEGHRDAMFHV